MKHKNSAYNDTTQKSKVLFDEQLDRTSKIKIIHGLPELASKSTKLVRTISAYYHLKYYFPNGVIMNVSSKAKSFAESMEISERTFWKRIKELKELKLAKYDDENRLHIASFDKLHTLLGVEIYPKQRYHYVPMNLGVKLEYTIRALAIKDAQKRQFYKAKRLIEQYYQSSISTTKAKRLMEESTHRLIGNFVYGEETTELDNLVRSDTSVSQYNIGGIMGGRNASNGNYWTKKLVASELMESKNIKIKSEIRARSSDLGVVFWSRRSGTTVLQLPNRIKFL